MNSGMFWLRAWMDLVEARTICSLQLVSVGKTLHQRPMRCQTLPSLGERNWVAGYPNGDLTGFALVRGLRSDLGHASDMRTARRCRSYVILDEVLQFFFREDHVVQSWYEQHPRLDA